MNINELVNNSNLNVKFKVEIIKRTVINEITHKEIDKQEVVIKLVNATTGIGRIHPFTEFLDNYRSCKTKSIQNNAEKLVAFLNFVYLSPLIDINNFSELTIEHGALFLENCGYNRETTIYIDNILTSFYKFLFDKKILKNVKKEDFTYYAKANEEAGTIKPQLNSLFKTKYTLPDKNIKNGLHHLKPEFIFPFLETAIRIDESIALGIYFEFFGGLRGSEVVLCKYSQISKTKIGNSTCITILLKDDDLRPDTKTGFIAKAKKNRKQYIYDIGNGTLNKLFENHKKKFKAAGIDAMFLDANGNPMTSITYRNRFNKVRDAFIKSLLDSEELTNRSYGLFLKSQNWSTHIGRGIFSNLTAENATNVVEIATMRGDSNLSSALPYVSDTEKVAKQIDEMMSNYYIDIFKQEIKKGE